MPNIRRASTQRRVSPTRWLSLYLAQVEQQSLLWRLGVLLEFVMREEHATLHQRLELVYRLRLCFESTLMWQELESLISRARRDWPVLSPALSPTSDQRTLTTISDLLHDPSYIRACLSEHEASLSNQREHNSESESEIGSDISGEVPRLVTPELSDIDDELEPRQDGGSRSVEV
ncbi:hypothetical protein QCA50_010866 [Cerrena zonata]|uniref:Uncharacterized protein n=1 Tax=Cerrena zonata TaxID=2478898 RepID=A0AAW0G2Z0_9APHY